MSVSFAGRLLATMNEKDLYLNARRYYAVWAGVRAASLDEEHFTLETTTYRDKTPPGYSRPFPLYCLVRPRSLHICVGTRAAAGHPAVMDALSEGFRLTEEKLSVDQVANCLSEIGLAVTGIANKYFLKTTEYAQYSDTVKCLTENDYPAYEYLFKSVWPNANPAGWLEEYFCNRLVKHGYAWGTFIEGVLVSATDAASVPYMADQILEPGIKTHPDYRNRGHAHSVCSTQVRHVLDRGITPVWSCGTGNVASVRLAEGLGFAEFGTAITADFGDDKGL